jgi:hypothetical protein
MMELLPNNNPEAAEMERLILKIATICPLSADDVRSRVEPYIVGQRALGRSYDAIYREFLQNLASLPGSALQAIEFMIANAPMPPAPPQAGKPPTFERVVFLDEDRGETATEPEARLVVSVSPGRQIMIRQNQSALTWADLFEEAARYLKEHHIDSISDVAIENGEHGKELRMYI